jgi:hypothetical protein
MPVTIDNLTSNINVVDSNRVVSDTMIAQIVQLVMARLRQERTTEELNRQEREITNHSTVSELF